MNRQAWWNGWIALALLAGGCKANDADTLARIGRKIVHHGERLTGGNSAHLACRAHAVRGSLSDASLDSRVTTRLRWDRFLADADVHVRSQGKGVVRLEGTVPDAAHRRRAVELAGSTVGVEEVVDQLTVGAPQE